MSTEKENAGKLERRLVEKKNHERNVQVASEIPAKRRTNVPKCKNPKTKENLDEEKSSRRSKEMPNYTGMESKRK
ncbi:hypothetical protein RUM43_002584 [Polyplax serrata]|uniref:Uncharacterized protein n=1 Tax=Polyplax serrata TaxID=468196 RepID=A0AAN8PCZ2_POLSC